MLNLTADLFTAFQNKLKTGNRRGVHLNAIPGNSRYKLDLAQLADIHKTLPEYFIVDLLTQKNVSFKFSIHDQYANEDGNIPDGDRDYLNDYTSEEEKETNHIEVSKVEKSDDAKNQKLVGKLENLIFQNEVIYSEKGVNSLGFGFPLLVRKDLSDGQITVAPLLIWSINIKATNEMNTWEIKRTEEDPIYLNEVLINHLQSDSDIILNPISEQMLADGKIDKPELFDICDSILRQLKVNQDLNFLLSNYEEIPLIKTKIAYEDLLPEKGDALIIKSGLFSIFEVQKQNIINDYETLKREFKPFETDIKSGFQSITAIETDPSQQNVLESLKHQNKILIQGPPGTGKSQTLTALLVNALENKQKTIVVCEKQTALEVLYQAMNQLGFDRYCTMIKDSTTDRKLVVNAVRNTIDSTEFKKPILADFTKPLDLEIEAISTDQENINEVHSILNNEILPSKNWSNIVGTILKFQTLKEEVDLSKINFTFSEKEFTEIEELINTGSPLYRQYQFFKSLYFLDTDKLISENFHQSLDNLDRSFQKYESDWNEIKSSVEKFKPLFVQKSKQIFLQNLNQLNTFIDEIEIMTSTLSKEDDQFSPATTDSFFYKLSALFSSSKRSKIYTQKKIIEISSAVKEISLNTYFPAIDISSDLWNNRNTIINYRSLIQNAQQEFEKSVELDFDTLDFNNLFDKNIADEHTNQISNKIQELRKTILFDHWVEENNFGVNYLQTKEFLDLILKKYSSIRTHSENPLLAQYNWFSFYDKLSDFQKNLLVKLYPIQNWEASLLSAYLPIVLNYHSVEQLNFKENHYADLVLKLKKYGIIQKSFIEQYWNTMQQDAVKKFEIENKGLSVANLFNKRSSTNHARLTLRQIAQKDLDLFTAFFPIILTTPDVCSNLFQNKNYYFDHVVFDEASQLKLEDNLPAMLKAKNIIIAGDQHQMPPSNYFSKVFEGSIEDEDDLEGENEVITYKNAMLNIESLLDFAMENNFEKNHLDFHYRSKHPYLIDFSNHAFYNARLKPLPAKSKDKPIEFFQVDGVFEDHINEEEASKVLEILEAIEPKENGNFPSVGIATFNITQRNYIKRLILQRCSLPDKSHFKTKINALEEAGLFIKNLENIQGDERDIIIISTTYGKKRSGKFVQSFGPVNHSNGYKLLNVIITRAKEKIYICNSIPEDYFLNYKAAIEDEGANNRKAVFYAYLAYCKAVSEENAAERTEILNVLDILGYKSISKSENFDSLFVAEIYRLLKEKFPDLKILKDHQFGGYSLDLLIEQSNGKSIVVECMSKPQYTGKLPYMEDMHKAKILKNSGYDYVRLWSQNCWQNVDSELQKIINKII